MEPHSKIFNCIHCDYISKWKANIVRHVVRNHSAPKDTDAAPKDTDSAPKDTDYINNTIIHDIQCMKCNKVYSRKNIMLKHQEKCEGSNNPLQCEYCSKIFAFRTNKYAHRKICKLHPDICKVVEPNIQHITNNITNSTNNTNNNTNNIDNSINNTLNNTINIITYNPQYTELMPIVPKHIEKIKRMIKTSNTKNSKEIMRIIRQFADYSLALYQNRFVIKNNLRSSYSSVHCGNNNWKHFVDRTIMPQFTNSIVGSFQELIQDACDMKKHQFMNEYIDEMYSHGELKYDTDACKDYAMLLEELKLKIYDLTKDIGNYND